MKRLLLGLNVLATLVIIAFGLRTYVAPAIAVAWYEQEYQERMFACDQAMREHFIAKQTVLRNTTTETVRNLDAAEIGLTTCHDYDRLRKRLLAWGASEADLSILGLTAIEKRASDIRTFVEIHEIRY